jgi:hypothetical protein
MLPMLTFGAVSTAVAVKLLLLAHRTRQIPELSISLGILLIGTIGLPMAIVGRMPGNFGTDRGSTLFAIGILIACFGMEMSYVFPWYVFRRTSKWARAVVAGSSAGFVVVWILIVTLGSGATDVQAAQAQVRPYAVALISLQLLGSAWSSAEAFRYWGMQKKRLRLGLANPVVVQRFLWWGVSNLATAILGATMIACLLQGKMVLRDPFALFILNVTGTVLSFTWGLSFFPPRFYVRWVEARAETVA